MESNKDLIITVKAPKPNDVGWVINHYEIFARIPRYKKWWKFWEDNYKELPLQIIGLKGDEDIV